MKCNEVLQHLNEYIENDLDESLMDEIKSHIEKCSECRKAYEEEKELNDMFLEALNSEPVEFNSRIGNIMNMIDKDKYSSENQEKQVIETVEDSKVIKFESVNNKKEKKSMFNKKIIAMAATFTIMIFMAPFIIGEQKKDMQMAVESYDSTFEQDGYKSNKTEDKVANKENNTQSIASLDNEKAEEEMQETRDAELDGDETVVQEENEVMADANLKEDVAVVQASDEQVNNGESTKSESMAKASVTEKSNLSTRVSFAADYKTEYLEKEHKIVLSNEESGTKIKVNNEQEELGIIDGIITSFVEDGEYVYIACAGMDTEKESRKSIIAKVNTEKDEIEIIYVSLKDEYIKEMELKEERINFFTIINGEQEKHKSMNK